MKKANISRSTLRWVKRRQNCGDHERAELNAARIRFQLETWERIRKCRRWTPLSMIYAGSKTANGRRVRRFIHVLDAAGMIQLRYVAGRPGDRKMEFRSISQ